MDHRPLLRLGRLFALSILSATLMATIGCSTMATALWIVRGADIPAEFKELKGKRVVVACQPLAELTYRDSSAAQSLAREMNKLLAENVRHVEMVDQRKVTEWIDENVLEDFTDIGEAMEADFVVGVNLERFGVYQGQTVYQGKARVSLEVYDCQTGELVFERQLPEITYPPNSARAVGDQHEADFRREYIHVLADHVARHFYPHDPHADFAVDSIHFR